MPHVLFGDLTRFAVVAYKRGDWPLVKRIISLMERLCREGDDLTSELVGVSFVQNISPQEVGRDFFALYGPCLRQDLKAMWGVVPPDGENANPS